MLCSRSASLMTSTRGSLAIATTILRIVSALAASPSLTLSSLVTPSTSSATSPPKSSRIWSRVYSVSSIVSCSSAATSVVVSMPRLARIVATAERVGDVRVAGLAELPGVPVVGRVVGALQQPGVGLGVGGPVGGDQRLEHLADLRCLPGRVEPGQPGPHPAPGRRAGQPEAARGRRRRPGLSRRIRVGTWSRLAACGVPTSAVAWLAIARLGVHGRRLVPSTTGAGLAGGWLGPHGMLPVRDLACARGRCSGPPRGGATSLDTGRSSLRWPARCLAGDARARNDHRTG